VSDVYQDVFQEGSFIGKGIYDVDAFERALHGRFPENTVLSHDLLEACHARSALVSDVEFYEEYPFALQRGHGPAAPLDSRRLADHAMAPAARSRGRTPAGLPIRCPPVAVEDLRQPAAQPRPVALLLLLLGNWLLLPELAVGNAAGAGDHHAPRLVGGGRQPVSQARGTAVGDASARRMAAAGGRQLGQILLTLAFLPYDAFISLDAIGRTLLRLLVTRKRLLEWQTSSDAERARARPLAGFYPRCGSCRWSPWTTGHCAWPSSSRSNCLWRCRSWVFWLAAPWIAWRISQPIEPRHPVYRRNN
jgi:cyclic beta-1,2-glucan synthetase